jgi:HSP20 family protein
MLPARLDSFRGYPIFSFRRDIDRLLGDFLRELGAAPAELESVEGALAPTMDVTEVENGYEVEADLPGIDPKDIKVEVTGNTLTILGERREEKEEREGTARLRERSSRRYFRSITLPEAVDPGKISAEFENGCLCITVPKSERAQRRAIDVKVAEGPRRIEAETKPEKKPAKKAA